MIYYAFSRNSKSGAVLAKLTPFVNGDAINEPGDVWFEFGPPAQAIDKLRAEIEQYARSKLN